MALLKPSDKERFFELITAFKKTHVLVIGDFILDQFIWGSVDRISPEAPVPVVKVSRESYMLGGCLNVAHNIHSLGGNVYPCGVVGRDPQGRLLGRAIRKESINTGGIVYDAQRPTSLKTRIIAHSQQVVRFDRESLIDIAETHRRKMLDFVRKQIKSMDLVIIEDYGKGVVTPALLRPILTLAKKYKKPVLVDPKERHFSYYSGATTITPNRKEAFAAYANNVSRKLKPSLEDVGWGLLKKLHCKSVLITLGEDGMVLFEKGKRITRIPTTAQEVYDVSGAGDSVMAAFGLVMAAGGSMRDAAMLANLAAGIVVEKLGTAIVSLQELKEAIQSHQALKVKKKKKVRGRR